MSLVGKNRALFSYNNKDKSDSNFMYKDFEKTNSYHTYFARSNFSYASLRAAKMKYCNFSGCIFNETEFVGTNFRGSSFRGATFTGAIFSNTILEGTDFFNSQFSNCFIIGTSFSKSKRKPTSLEENGNTIFSTMPRVNDFSPRLIEIVESLRCNDVIRRSHTLHLRNGQINTLTLYILRQIYSDSDLEVLFPRIPNLVSSQFYTVSYLKMLLKKAQ